MNLKQDIQAIQTQALDAVNPGPAIALAHASGTVGVGKMYNASWSAPATGLSFRFVFPKLSMQT